MPLSRLNPEQLQAAKAPFGHNLIIASAGTGKTSTIVGRIGYLLSQGVNPEEILLLTFTNKAAAEMVERVAGYFSRDVAKRIEAGTFHAVSYRWLKKLKRPIILKQPGELKTLFRSIYEKRQFHHIGAEAQPLSANFLHDVYSLYQNATLEDFSEWLPKRHEGQEPFIDIYLDIVREFEETKKEFGFVNFNDLLILMRDEAKRTKLPFKEVLIDEYQDTNELQGSLIDAMDPPSLFCVGDYDQSIYAFNGANIHIIGSFTKKFLDARVFTLTKNYRSTAPILSLANRVIEYNERIYPKQLEVVRQGSRQMPKLLIFDNLLQQYETIAQMIRRSTTPHPQIAVIFRNNASADGIEAMLREQNIPCKRKGGRSFFDAKEVKAALDIATLMANPKDMMAFIHIFEYAKGIGSATAKELFEGLVALGEGSMLQGIFRPKAMTNPFKARTTNYQLGLFDHPTQIGSVSRFAHLGFDEQFIAHPILKHPALNSDGVRFIHDFFKLAASLKQKKQPQAIVRSILSSTTYGYIIEQLAIKRATLKNGEVDELKKEEAMERIKRKGVLLIQLASAYNTLEKFINAMVLGGGELSEGEGVNLLTVHASKGLEFDEVYVIDLMDGRFPNRKLASQAGLIEEERRLFYVAVTRAKNLLYLSYAKYDSFKDITFFPSQFLYEAALLKKDQTYEKLKTLC
ncbi:ATP-dependent helicase [Hydrogenimonas cancrithermarum]|uniref:DNA 3'-5' helicase n=1 Tax=Hydrogenimonas cancrithermarum TaxID=2993563 RepID=A0ABM8FI90_9BACT|nr:ATP-dependent helicase [Hydrogenimonas cancrithermarum]BDY11984.1 DNA helicase [Hydrogenimonas cancrithermarum]